MGCCLRHTTLACELLPRRPRLLTELNIDRIELDGVEYRSEVSIRVRALRRSGDVVPVT